MKRLAQTLASSLAALVPEPVAFSLLNRLAPVLLRRNLRYAPALVYLLAGKYSRHARRRFGVEHLLRFDVPLGYAMYIPVSDNHLVHRGFGVYHPRELLATIVRLCPPGTRACEIGTHLGEMTLFLARLVGPAGRVYAFEIDDVFCDIVRRSVAANAFEHVTVEHAAVGEPDQIPAGAAYGDIRAAIESFPDLNVASALGTDFFTQPPEQWNRSELPRSHRRPVERIDLCDYFVSRNCPIEFFFMDIEGSEIYAIPQIVRLGRHFAYRPKIVFEVHHNAYSGPQVRELRQLLVDAGYRMTTPDDRHVVCE